jgi:hypothetical protein
MKNRHFETMRYRSILILYFLDKVSIADNGLAFFCGDELFGRRLITRKIE